MRCVLAMVAAIFITVAPVCAQRGGGHATGGGHGGGMASRGGFGGSHAFSGTHSGAGFGSGSSSRAFSGRASSGQAFSGRSSSGRAFSHSGFGHSPLASRHSNGFRGPRIRSRGFRNSCFWYGCGWGYAYPYLGGGIDPYWWWDSGSSDDQNQQYGAYGAPDYDGANYGGPNYEGRNGEGDQDAYARSAPPQPVQQEKTEAVAPTVLIFRDQHKQEVQNYAIVGQTLWAFAPQRTQKIPLTDLDLPATTKANDERGVDFRVPGA